jgi:uncharacterized membrane protein
MKKMKGKKHNKENVMKTLKNDKKGMFGLNAVQSFFAIILGIALLAYVIVIIMGTLGTSTIVPQNTLSTTVINESLGKATPTGITLTTGANALDGTCGALTAIYNGTGGVAIRLANVTQTGCTVVNATSTALYGATWLYSYTYTSSISTIGNGRSILTNVSTGIASFFGAINPVYAILAILVIILVLVVLVRVVQAPSGSQASPQL